MMCFACFLFVNIARHLRLNNIQLNRLLLVTWLPLEIAYSVWFISDFIRFNDNWNYDQMSKYFLNISVHLESNALSVY